MDTLELGVFNHLSKS